MISSSNILISQNDTVDVGFEDELDQEAVVRDYRTTAFDMHKLCYLANKRG